MALGTPGQRDDIILRLGMRPGRDMHRVGIVCLAIALSACSASSTSLPVETELDPPTSSDRPGDASEPNAADDSSVGESQTAESLARAGVTVGAGFSPHAHLGRTDGMLTWPDREDMPGGIGDPPIPPGLGPLAITSTIRFDPISCIEWTRSITAVDVGDGPSASRIEEEIEQVARAEAKTFLASFGAEEDCAGLGPESGASIGDSYQELAEEPCVLPDGPPLRCFVLADLGYEPGAAHSYLRHHQLVFDATTGMRLLPVDLLELAGLDAQVALSEVTRILAVVTGTQDLEVRQARPTDAGLVFGFSPGEAGSWPEYTRDVLIPWVLLDEA